MNYDNKNYHTPVLLAESIEGLNIDPGGIYVDLTFGGGGHSRAIYEHITTGHLYGFDQDRDAFNNTIDKDHFTFVASNFRYLINFVDYYGIQHKVNGLIADLGVSSHHFDQAERGFSFRSLDSLLDMRMNQSSPISARDVVNSYAEEDIARLLYDYGELRQSRKIARSIVECRGIKPINTVGELLQAIDNHIDPRDRKRQLGQLFQAIRIEVNDELSALKDMLDSLSEVMAIGGRIVIITYHSLEDKIVKDFFRKVDDSTLESQIYGRRNSNWKIINRKPIIPSLNEINDNPRSRSAKLRIIEYNPHN